jgi:hypothetical protein
MSTDATPWLQYAIAWDNATLTPQRPDTREHGLYLTPLPQIDYCNFLCHTIHKIRNQIRRRDYSRRYTARHNIEIFTSQTTPGASHIHTYRASREHRKTYNRERLLARPVYGFAEDKVERCKTRGEARPSTGLVRASDDVRAQGGRLAVLAHQLVCDVHVGHVVHEACAYGQSRYFVRTTPARTEGEGTLDPWGFHDPGHHVLVEGPDVAVAGLSTAVEVLQRPS